MSTVAIHVIWTTYMTWPPGDPRGHWSPLFDLYGGLIERGHKLNLLDPMTLQIAKDLAKESPRVLNELDQQIVAVTIDQVVRDLGVEVIAAAIERAHVHLLLGKTGHELSKLVGKIKVGKIKGRTSSEIVHRGSGPGRTRTWTHGYWHVFIEDLEVIPIVQRYIERHNERRGLPYAPYAWITPYIK